MTRFFDVADQSVTVVARSTAGAAVTGKVAADFTIRYRKGVVGALVTVTPSDLSLITTAHADGGVKELDATNAPGAYRVDLPDAAFTSGAGDSIVVSVKIAGAMEIHLEIELVSQITATSGALAANVTHFGGSAGTFAGGRPEVNASHIAGSAVSTSSAQIGVNVVNAGGTAWASGAITAASIATDAIDGDAIAATAVTEIQSGLATTTDVGDVESLASQIRTVTDKLNDTLEDDLGTFRFTTNALEQAPSGTGASAAAIRMEIDANSTQLAAILADTAALDTRVPADPADQSEIAALIDALPTAAENAAALLDLANGIETSITPRQALRLILASAAGKLSGAATTTITIRNVGDSKDRITATVDASGNRSSVTVDGT